MEQRMWQVIPMLALAFLTLLTACAATGPRDESRSPDAAGALRVTSFNLRYGTANDGSNHWDERRDLVVGTIRRFDPDVLGVQECLAEQAAFLQARLPHFEMVGVGRDDGSREGEMTAVFFRRDRFDLLTHGHFWLSEAPDEPGSRGWDASHPRMCTWVKLRDRDRSGLPAYVFNTHFDHAGVIARTASARLLRAKIGEIAEDEPVIVTGDFNAAADTAAPGPHGILLAPIAEGRSLVDVYRAAHPDRSDREGTYHGFLGMDDGARIDWILASSDWSVIEADIVRSHDAGRYPSDHFPVTALVLLNCSRHGSNDGR